MATTCYCDAYNPTPHTWFPPNQGGRCPVLNIPDPDQPLVRMCECVYLGGPNGKSHVWKPEGTYAGSAACPEGGPIQYLPPPPPTREREGWTADVYHGGGQRETNGDRPRFDLLWTRSQPPEKQMLHRDAAWYQKGAAKYGERNWEKFNSHAELVRAEASLGRHYAAFMAGLTDEDHAAAIRANVQFIEYIREQIAAADAAGEGTY